MTTKRKSVPPTPSMQKGNNWKGFVNIEIPEKAKENLLAMADSSGDVLGCVDDLLSNGFKLSLSLHDETSVYTAVATDNNEGGASYGYAVSARSTSLAVTLLALSYKVSDVAEYQLQSFIKPNGVNVDL